MKKSKVITLTSAVLGCASSLAFQLTPTSSKAGVGEGKSFGCYYQGYFEHSYLPPLLSRDNARSFSYRLDDVWRNDWGSPKELRGAKNKLEDSCDGCTYGLDTTDFVMIFTHAGHTSNKVIWAMWDYETYADSTAMSLGDENDGLRALASHACSTIDRHGNYKDHWRQAFKGGLIVALGADGCMTDSNDTAGRARAFADKLLSGMSMWRAWYTSMLSSENPYLRVLATANSSSECDQRRNVSLQNLTSTPRRRSFSTWCHSSAEF